MQTEQSTHEELSGQSRKTEDEILREHEGLLRYMALPFATRAVAFDDLLQEARIALLRAVRTWRPDGGASIWTYGRRFVFGALLRYAASDAREPSRPNSETLIRAVCESSGGEIESCSFETTFVDPDALSPEDVSEIAADLEVLEKEIDALSDLERDVLWRIYGEEQDVRAIGQHIGVSKSVVDRIKHTAIAKLRERVEAAS